MPYRFKSITTEFLADTETPVSVYLKVKSKNSCLLESVEGEERLARYSYIGINPFMTFEATLDGTWSMRFFDDAFKPLREELKGQSDIPARVKCLLTAFEMEDDASEAMLKAGAFGFISYDAAAFVETLTIPKKENPIGLPDIQLLFYHTLIVFDNVRRKIVIISNYLTSQGQVGQNERAAKARIEAIQKVLFTPLSAKDLRLSQEKSELLTSNQTKKQYLQKVAQSKEYILAGDIFQVQISQRLSRNLNARPFDIYRALRTINPSPYLYYFDLGKVQIIGSSPELLVGVERNQNGDRIVQTRPIAGTRKRGKTPEEDATLEKELLADEKERAEHLMLIDLSRNDIGKIAAVGSVETNEMMIIERYSHVMHIVSNVKGKLRDDLHPLDAFWSCFPAGTLTGAPKIRAMEIISELEGETRGLYGGAVGYFDFRGNIKTAIAIRTMVTTGTKIYFQAAGGIVTDSIPENEFEETLSKMRAGVRAVEFLLPKTPEVKAGLNRKKR